MLYEHTGLAGPQSLCQKDLSHPYLGNMRYLRCFRYGITVQVCPDDLLIQLGIRFVV